MSLHLALTYLRTHWVRLVTLGWVIALAVAFMGLTINRMIFYPDGWTYYEISRTIFTDFYKVNTIRQYQHNLPYSDSFPPLYPLFIAIFNTIYDVGIYAGYFVNVALLACCIVPCWLILRNVTSSPERCAALSFVLWFILMVDRDLLEEAMRAKSAPLILLLFLCILAKFAKPQAITLRSAVIIGALAGLACMTRFDFNITALSLVCAVALFANKGQRWKTALTYLLSLATFVSPWIIYSLLRFHTFYASDNKLTAITVKPVHVLEYYPEPPETLFENFAGWYARVSGSFTPALESLFENLRQTPLSIPVITCGIMMGAVYVFAYAYQRRQVPRFSISNLETSSPILRLFIISILTTTQFIGSILTSYFEPRYSVLFVGAIVVTIFIMMIRVLDILTPRLLAIACILLCLVNSHRYFFQIGRAIPFYRSPFYFAMNPKYSSTQDLETILSCVGLTDRFLYFGKGGERDYVNSRRLGALTGILVYPGPKNWDTLTTEQKLEFLKKYQITRIFVSSRLEENPVRGIPVHPSTCEDIYLYNP